MTPFTQSQRIKALFWLSLFHLLVIISSNYLVQLPITIFGFHTTWGAFSFPFIFLATDLTVRIFGAPLARRIIFAVMIPALLVSYVVSSLFYMGAWQGFAALANFNRGWRRPLQRCLAISAIPLPFSSLRSGEAPMLIFFLPMYGVLLNMLLKKLADKSEISPLPAS